MGQLWQRKPQLRGHDGGFRNRIVDTLAEEGTLYVSIENEVQVSGEATAAQGIRPPREARPHGAQARTPRGSAEQNTQPRNSGAC